MGDKITENEIDQLVKDLRKELQDLIKWVPVLMGVILLIILIGFGALSF